MPTNWLPTPSRRERFALALVDGRWVRKLERMGPWTEVASVLSALDVVRPDTFFVELTERVVFTE